MYKRQVVCMDRRIKAIPVQPLHVAHKQLVLGVCVRLIPRVAVCKMRKHAAQAYLITSLKCFNKVIELLHASQPYPCLLYTSSTVPPIIF